jgi:hypothetical protein
MCKTSSLDEVFGFWRPIMRLALLIFLGLCAVTPAQDKPKPNSVGDVAGTLTLAEGYEVPAFTPKEGPYASGPFHCSECALAKKYAAGASLPSPPARLWKRPASDVIDWLRDDQKVKSIVISTEHVVLLIELPAMPVKWLEPHEKTWLAAHGEDLRKEVSSHARAHLYAYRFLRLQAAWLDLMGVTEGPRFVSGHKAKNLGCKERGEVYVLAKAEVYRAFTRHFFGNFGPRSSWWYDIPTETVVAAFQAEEVTDTAFHGIFAHCMSHHLLMQYRGFYQTLPLWLVEGMGHFFQRRVKGSEPHRCVLGVEMVQPLPGDWWNAIKDKVRQGAHLPMVKFGTVDTKNFALKPDEHVQAWSVFSYLVSAGAKELRLFIDELKSRSLESSLAEAQLKACERALGVSTKGFEDAWKAWVLATKPGKTK